MQKCVNNTFKFSGNVQVWMVWNGPSALSGVGFECWCCDY